MRSIPFLLAGLLLALGIDAGSARAAQTAQVRMFCLSVRVEPATSRQLGLEHTLEFTSADFAPGNQEVYPIFDETFPFTHLTRFRFDGTDFSEPILGELALNTPEELDDNTNGIPDFYEVAAAVPATTLDGIWDSDAGRGTAKVTWQRGAGDYRGTCKIRLVSDDFGALGEFTHAFAILEYGGTLTYTPSLDPVPTVLAVHRIGSGLETNTLLGPLILNRQPTNRLAQFTLAESVVTNQLGLALPISVGDVEKDSDYSMSYFGAMSFANGDPETPEVDYELFYIGVDDLNDADHDGFPDLTDDVGNPPSPPRLALAPAGDRWQLTLSGEKGVTYALEFAQTLHPDLWREDRKVTLTETNQVLLLAKPSPAAGFWRLRWP